MTEAPYTAKAVIDAAPQQASIPNPSMVATEAMDAFQQFMEWFELARSAYHDSTRWRQEKPYSASDYTYQEELDFAENRVNAKLKQLTETPMANFPTKLTPDLISILGRPNFSCAPIARALRLRGDEIPGKAEEEQAASIWFLLQHYVADPANWIKNANAEIQILFASRLAGGE